MRSGTGQLPQSHPSLGQAAVDLGVGPALARHDFAVRETEAEQEQGSALVGLQASKGRKTFGPLLGEAMAEVVGQTELPEADLVVSVPGQADAGFDRFAVARAGIAEVLGANDGRGILEMVRDCENYLDLDLDQRRMINQGRFRATRELAGERVLLIDGVIASGSLTRACARELLGAGAGEVWTLVAAVSQDAFQRECP